MIGPIPAYLYHLYNMSLIMLRKFPAGDFPFLTWGNNLFSLNTGIGAHFSIKLNNIH